MNKIFFLLFVPLICLSAPQWKEDQFVELKKDEFFVMLFQSDGSDGTSIVKRLYFRWTLHKNNGLVMHLNYDYFPHQFILYEDYGRNCYKIPLFKPEPRKEAPYFMLCFKDYHRGKKIATLKYYIYDGDKNFNIIDKRKVENGGFGAN